jgi:HK97 family phage major capsid protein
MDVKALIEERLKLNADSHALLDANPRGLSPEQNAQFDAMHKRIAEIKEITDRQALVDAEDRAMAESRGRKTSPELAVVPNSREQDANLAFRAWALGNNATDEQIAAAERIGFRYMRTELDTRALSSVTATQGQASIPDELMRAYVEMQKWYGRVRAVAEVIPTTGGNPLPIPTTDDTANTGEIVGDGGAVTTTVDPLFGVITLGAFKYSSKAVIVPIELLQDSAINLPVYLGSALGTRIGRKQNSDYTVGGGTTLPWGVSIKASLGKTAAATNALTFDDFIDLFHGVDIAYRGRPGSAFMIHDTIAQYARKLKAATSGQYLWEMSLQAGKPDRMLGEPVIINNDMPNTMTTGLTVALYGDFYQYKIREAGPVEVKRADELRILNGQVVFLAFQRADANLADVTAVRYLKQA